MRSWAQRQMTEDDKDGTLQEILETERQIRQKYIEKSQGRLMSPETRYFHTHGYEPPEGIGLDGYPLMRVGGRHA